MNLYLPIKIALRCIIHQRSGRFAGFIALLSVIGIAIGVGALITVSTVMQSLQGRLKSTVLNNTPHITVYTTPDHMRDLLKLPHVNAAAPFINRTAVVKSGDDVALVNVQGLDAKNLFIVSDSHTENFLPRSMPGTGSYALIADAALFNRFHFVFDQKIKLISTVNARYTPAGLTPSSRIFTLIDYQPSLRDTLILNAVGDLEDVRRLFRLKDSEVCVRLWLDDPMNFEETEKALQAMNLNFEDWRSQQGDFFRSVAMEKLSMTIMLCLIVIVAAFNILSSLSMSVSSRIHDIAVLKTLGMRSSSILYSFMLQGLILGGAGALIGIALGIILSLNSNALLILLGVPAGNSLPVSPDPIRIFVIAISAVLLSLICTLYPAIKAASADPASNLNKA